MIGQWWSASQNACMIRFVGGPWDGESGLFDHDRFDAIYCGGAMYTKVGPRLYELKDRRSRERRRRATDRRADR